MTHTQAKLEQLTELETQLNTLLDNEEYEQFQEQQSMFTEQLNTFLNNNSEDDLLPVIVQLKQLETRIAKLQERSTTYLEALKEKSRLLKLNKNKIKAYT